MESYAQMDFLNIPVKGLCLEEITGSLPAASSNVSRLVRFNGKPYWSDGATWIDLSAIGTGGSSVQLPQNTKFVSPNFTNVSPFYSSISTAIGNSNNGDYIIVFPGTYTGNHDLSKRHWYFHEGARIVGTSTINFEAATSITGHAIFDGQTTGTAIDTYYGSAPIFGLHRLEFDTAYSNVMLNSWSGSIEFNYASAVYVQGAATNTIDADKIYIDAKYIGYLDIESIETKLFANIENLEFVTAKAGDTVIEFKRILLTSYANAVVVFGTSTGSKTAKLKLIDGNFPADWNSANPPILIGDYAQVELQHIWVKNAHREAILLNGNIRNSHLLKVDNCILIANQAIDATISGQDVYCFGSWGQNDVSTNINMVTESLNVGSIW